MLYAVNEVFSSIQGEGTWTGNPCVFVRFAGCNLHCNWCDTNHKKRFMAHEHDLFSLIWKVDKDPHHIVLTGGEPTMQDLVPFLKYFREQTPLQAFFIQIETNGTMPKVLDYLKAHELVDWVTVSPKTLIGDISRGIKLADELKVVLEPDRNPMDFIALGGEHTQELMEERLTWIQPLSGNVQAAVDYVNEHRDWRLGVQLHKLIGVR